MIIVLVDRLKEGKKLNRKKDDYMLIITYPSLTYSFITAHFSLMKRLFNIYSVSS